MGLFSRKKRRIAPCSGVSIEANIGSGCLPVKENVPLTTSVESIRCGILPSKSVKYTFPVTPAISPVIVYPSLCGFCPQARKISASAPANNNLAFILIISFIRSVLSKKMRDGRNSRPKHLLKYQRSADSIYFPAGTRLRFIYRLLPGQDATK